MFVYCCLICQFLCSPVGLDELKSTCTSSGAIGLKTVLHPPVLETSIKDLHRCLQPLFVTVIEPNLRSVRLPLMFRGPRRKRTADEVVEECRVQATASQQQTGKAGQGSRQGRPKILPIWPAAKLTALQVSGTFVLLVTSKPHVHIHVLLKVHC